MNSIEMTNLEKHYGERVIFSKISLAFPETGFIAILGDSGSGKSSLLDLIAGLDIHYEGTLRLWGHSLKGWNERRRSEFRLREIGYLRQGCDLLELESALENVILPLRAASHMSEGAMRRKGLALLTSLGLAKKANQRVNTLSGGEKQRVALARALINDPRILLADEPTGALDHANAEAIFSSLQKLALHHLVFLVSHDQALVEAYAGEVYRLQDGQLSLLSKRELPKLEAEKALIPSHLDKKVPSLPFSSWLNHAKHLFEAKKARSFLACLILIFSLLALGLSLYVERDLGSELGDAFSSLSGEECVVAERKNEGNTLSRVVALNEGKAAKILADYPSLAFDYGVSYLAPFESFFKDENEAFVMSDSTHQYLLPNFSIRSVADFLWLDSYEGRYYPEEVAFTEDDEVVVGLPTSGMEALCFALHILRSYESLGNYLSHQGLQLLFQMENADWTYADEQLFRITAFVPYEIPTLFHSNHRWNEFVLQTKMRFPSSDEEDHSLPWILQKLVYLEPRGSPREMLRKVQEIPELSDYVFERSSYSYDQSHNLVGKLTSQQRLYVYLTNKNSLPNSLITSLAAEEAVSSYQLCNEGGYRCYPEALSSGFANPFYLTPEPEDLETVLSLVSNTPVSEAKSELSLPSSVVSGSFLTPVGTGLSFSSQLSSLLSGKSPLEEDEIAISSSLDSLWNHPKSLMAGALASSQVVGERLLKDYRAIPLKVVGVVEEKNKVIYSDGAWTVDFFRDQVGVSSFLLEPEKVILHLKDPKSANALASKLSKAYPSYHFLNPSAKVKDSIAEVVGYLHLLLSLASCLALAISLFLLLTLGVLHSEENAREGNLLFLLGFSRNDIAESYAASFFLFAFFSASFAFFVLLFLEKILHEALALNFASTSRFSWDCLPLLSVVFFAFIGFILVSIFIIRWIDKRDFRQEKR
jgi:ABC-type lipoprotein export system ATPase subunit